MFFLLLLFHPHLIYTFICNCKNVSFVYGLFRGRLVTGNAMCSVSTTAVHFEYVWSSYIESVGAMTKERLLDEELQAIGCTP